jgi:hypothetical protein
MDRAPLRKIVESGTREEIVEFVETVKKDKYTTTTWKRVVIKERRVLRLECGHICGYARGHKKKRVGCYECWGYSVLADIGTVRWDSEIK